jgi:hypothetical protein
MGNFLKGVLKLVMLLAFIAGLGLYVMVNHSQARQELVCKGHWKDAPQESETAYVDLNEYRWWVRLYDNPRGGVVTLSQIERNSPITANAQVWDFIDLAVKLAT